MQLRLTRLDGNGLSHLPRDNGPGTLHDWSLTNTETTPQRIRAVSLVFAVDDVVGDLRLFRHGYQSWSPSDVAIFGTDVDPSTIADSEFFQASQHADQRTVTAPDELRSEWVTVLQDDAGAVLVGFIGGGSHDGTLRLRHAADGAGIELHAEAFLGDAELPPGATRGLHPLIVEPTTDPAAALDAWAKVTGATAKARTTAAYQVGWCSWYHYFHDVTEADIRANLALAPQFPFDVFQIDDGYQAHIGDWLATNDKFPRGLAALAADIKAAGYRPGIWIAPFLVAPDAPLVTEHPDWLAQFRPGKPLKAWANDGWGGVMYGLDTTNLEVQDHLAHVARTLVEWGYTYIKLDFTFAPSMDGLYADPTQTPAERVRAGFDAIRRGAGEDAFLLGCGAPLSNVVGVIDGNRIGADVAPWWDYPESRASLPGYTRTHPATLFAHDATIARSFMHRRLWLNDPDCLMLRSDQTELSAADAARWAHTVGLSGGMALVSDDLALLGDAAKAQLAEAIALGRASDDATLAGRCPLRWDLL